MLVASLLEAKSEKNFTIVLLNIENCLLTALSLNKVSQLINSIDF